MFKTRGLIRIVWLVMLFGVLCATPTVVASAFSAASTSLSPEYDGQNQARIVYDAPLMKAFDYDVAFVFPTSDSENRTGERGSIFAQVAEFLAAKSGVPVTANFAQTSFREAFSKAGAAELSRITGTPIKTIDDLAAALRSGAASPSQVLEMAMANGKIWVHGNATEHIAEYATSMLNRGASPSLVNTGIQSQLTSLQAAVNAATVNKVQFGKVVNVGGWELKFGPPLKPGQLPALIHALPK